MEIQIVDDNVQPILGLKSSLDMNSVNRVYTVNRNQSTESVEGLLNEYDHLFHGIGCLPGKYDIKVDHRVKPVVAPRRRIPHTLKDKVREELQRMESMKIISKVETPTRWVSPIVEVKKPSGKVRICLDPRELIKAILREHYPLKTVEEVAASLKQAKHFTTMDVASGFYQIQLTEGILGSQRLIPPLADTSLKDFLSGYLQHRKCFRGRCLKCLKISHVKS